MGFCKKSLIIIAIIVNLLAIERATSHNFDTVGVKVFEDPAKFFGKNRASYFGFATALYDGSEGAFVLVGAPRANVSGLRFVREPGTVYRCPIKSEDSTCVEWNLDPSGNGRIFDDRKFSNVNQIKDDAWIGASIAVEDSDEPRVVVCGPRWKNNIIQRGTDNWFMNGICYSSVDSQFKRIFQRPAENRIIPLLGNAMQVSSGSVKFYNYGMGQTGFSLHTRSTNNQSNLVIGNPGVYNWKGVPLLFTKYFPGGLESLTMPQIGSEWLIRSSDYLGYSVTSGYYFGRGDLWYASGAPRSAEMRGRVLIFRFPFTTEKKLQIRNVLDGEQQGEYFGASLASCDINNDGRDEIFVGAPNWSRYMDEGRVYVFSSKTNGEFELQTINGEVIAGRLGSIVTCLGDVDRDGYDDIAIGAPYEHDRGAVYIYNGNSKGLFGRYSQRLDGRTASPGMRGFGSSISEPRDIDGNGYADIAIGAYQSGHVVLVRSRPVAKIIVKLRNENVKGLQKNSTFFVVNVCTFYDGFRVPENLGIETTLEIDALEGRAFFGNVKSVDGIYKIPGVLKRGTDTCDQMRINLVKDFQNDMDPIDLKVSVSLSEASNHENHGPVINKMLSKVEDSTSLTFAVDCGSDNRCSSILDLSLIGDLEPGQRYTLGSKSVMKLVVGVANRGEPAYKTRSHIFVPSPIYLASLPRECTEYAHLDDGILEVICSHGNPLRHKKALVLELDMSKVPSDLRELNLFANLSTQSVNLNFETNTRNLTIYFDVDADIAVAGKSHDALYSYFDGQRQQNLETVRFEHIYEVQKFGQSPIEESELTVDIPTFWSNDMGNFEIARVNQSFGLKVGQQFFCSLQRDKDSSKNGFERMTAEENNLLLDVPPADRTIYLNCTNPAIKCEKMSCKLGSFANSLIIAKLTIIIDLQLHNFPIAITQGKDIVLFTSNSRVSMKQHEGIVHRVDNKPDSAFVNTIFVGSPIANGVPLWIIILSVVLGILLLIALTIGLVKYGFFHRKRKEQMKALIAENDENLQSGPGTVSSTESLDRNS